MNWKLATQEDLDTFMAEAVKNPEIYPYLSMNRYVRKRKVREDDWEGFHITNDSLSYMLHIDFERTSGLRFTLALYAKSAYSAGQAILVLKEMVHRYKPDFIDSTVALSNKKSYAITQRLLGEPWGIEPLGCWNMGEGRFEDCYYFRKVLI